MRITIFIALIAFLVVFVGRVFPLFGFDPLGVAIESANRSGAIGLVVGILILWAAALTAWVVHRWRLKPSQSFPWWRVASYGLVIVVFVFAYVRYAGELGP